MGVGGAVRGLADRPVRGRRGERARAHRLVASSYGPVWGVLGARGSWLYVADGVNYQDYYFDLQADPAGTRNAVTPELRAQNVARIREGLTRIHATWHIPAL